jgi:predicted HTH transcriptional regulator
MVAFLFADNNNISVRIGKYSGTDKEDLIEREDFKDCSLITAMKKIIDRLDMENVTQSRKRPMKARIDKSLVDKNVLHEVIINAFAHNDYSRNLDTPIFQIYSDRFEVMSFGGLVEGMTTEQFYTGTSMPRNREIVRVFKDLDYMEQLGSGIPKIVKKYGRGAISIDSFIIQATLQFDTGSETLSTTDSTTDKIISELKQNPYVTMDALAQKVGLTVHGVKWHMDKLKRQGAIRRLGAKNGGYWELINQQ